MKTREEKTMVTLIFIFIFRKYPSWAYIKKINTSTLVHDHSSCSTFDLHLVRGLKALYVYLLRNRTMEVGLLGKRHIPWSNAIIQRMVHGVTQPFIESNLKEGSRLYV
jgi:hypothetical protein